MSRPVATRPLTFQTLEERQAFAADLSLQFTNGDLSLTGDGDRESVLVEEVQGTGIAGSLEFLKITGQDGTTINGQAQVTVLSNNLRNVTINLNGGDDKLQLLNIDTALANSNLNVKLGGGNDRFNGGRLQFTGNISVEGEAGEDDIALNNLAVGGLLKLDLGLNDDTLVVTDSKAASVDLFGRGGNETLQFSRVNVTDRLFADLGDGDDFLVLDACRAGTFDLDGGDGENDALVARFDFGTFVEALNAVSTAKNFEITFTQRL